MTRRSLRLGGIALLTLALVWIGWWQSRGRNRLGVHAVVLITLDTCRADRLGCYGGDPAITPTLDRLAAEGVRFGRALSTAPITLPAHASILSGVDPIAHGVRVNGAFAMPVDNPSLPVSLQEQGFRTGAFVSAAVLDRRYGLSRGFDQYDDTVDPLTEERRGLDTVAAALQFVDESKLSRFFLWVHLFDAHAPYAAPEPFASQHADPYDGEVAYVDHCVATLLAGLAERVAPEDTLVAVVADHGEGLGDHGESTHTVFVYDSTLHVPMLFWSPAHLRPQVIASPASVISLAPTLLDLLDIERRTDMYGASFADGIRGAAAAPTTPVYFESQATEYYYGFAPLSGIDVNGDKLIVAPRGEWYRIPEDPHERDNRFGRDAARAAELKRQLDAYVRDHQTTRSAPRQLSAVDIDELRRLGYTQHPLDVIDDPKDGIAIVEALVRAQALSGADVDRSIAELRDLLRQYPQVAEIHEQLGEVLRHGKGDPAGALAEYQKAAGLRPNDPEILVSLAEMLIQTGRDDDARDVLRKALALEPAHVRGRVALGMLQLKAGLFESARRVFDEVLEGDPVRQLPANRRVPDAFYGRAMCLRQGNNLRLAQEDLQRAAAIVPGDFRYLFELAATHEALDQADDAIRVYESARRLAPAPVQAEIDSRLRRLRE